MTIQPAIFETHEIRRIYDEETETWWFSVVDIIQVLIQQPDFQAARNYWKVLKNRLAKEGSESVTNCNRLKLSAADGKKEVGLTGSTNRAARILRNPQGPPLGAFRIQQQQPAAQRLASAAKELDRLHRLQCTSHPRERREHPHLRALNLFHFAVFRKQAGVTRRIRLSQVEDHQLSVETDRRC